MVTAKTKVHKLPRGVKLSVTEGRTANMDDIVAHPVFSWTAQKCSMTPAFIQLHQLLVFNGILWSPDQALGLLWPIMSACLYISIRSN